MFPAAEWLKGAKTSDIALGQAKAVDFGAKRIAIFNIEGTYHAIDDTCTHRGGPLSEGMIVGTEVTCPWHGAVFDVTTGSTNLADAVKWTRKACELIDARYGYTDDTWRIAAFMTGGPGAMTQFLDDADQYGDLFWRYRYLTTDNSGRIARLVNVFLVNHSHAVSEKMAFLKTPRGGTRHHRLLAFGIEAE